MMFFATIGSSIAYTQANIDHNEAIIDLETRVSALESLDTFYPVGSIYTSVDAADPSERFGGTWSQLSVEISRLYFWQRTA